MAAGLPHVYVSRQDMPAMLSHVEALTQWLLDSHTARRAAKAAAPSPAPPSSFPGGDGAAELRGRASDHGDLARPHRRR